MSFKTSDLISFWFKSKSCEQKEKTFFVYHNRYLCIKVFERCRMPKREHKKKGNLNNSSELQINMSLVLDFISWIDNLG